MRTGFGYDSHRFTSGEYLVIGAEKIPFDQGLDAHSDGDVLLHALCDALLGAAAMGDIGKHFPDNDPKYKDIQSSELVKNVMQKLDEKNFKVGNVDSTVILEKPKLAAYIPDMQKNVSELLNVSLGDVNIKATTNEGMGFIGRGEGIAAYVSLTLMHIR
jgi:2-C-methyl-D-erythritol 2,4-cyclodiphosphate synthase